MLEPILMLLLISSTSAATSFVGHDQSQDGHAFKFEGFHSTNLSMDGTAGVTSNGLLRLTNTTSQSQMGHAFFSTPFPFSTMFAIAFVPLISSMGGNGIAFVISSTDKLVLMDPGRGVRHRPER